MPNAETLIISAILGLYFTLQFSLVYWTSKKEKQNTKNKAKTVTVRNNNERCTSMSRYRIYRDPIVDDDSTLAAFAKSFVSHIDLDGMDKSEAVILICDCIRDDLSRTNIDYEELLYKWRGEIGELLYDIENNGYDMQGESISFFDEKAKWTFQFLLSKYIEIHFEDIIAKN